MKQFKVQVELTCPSDWTEASVRAYIERIAATDAERASIRVAPAGAAGLEERVGEWVRTRVGVRSMQSFERAMRLLEETLELTQAECISEELVSRQVAEVYSRPAGEPLAEAAGVAVGILGWCAAMGHRFEDLAAAEIERIEQKPIQQIKLSLARKALAGVLLCVPEDVCL